MTAQQQGQGHEPQWMREVPTEAGFYAVHYADMGTNWREVHEFVRTTGGRLWSDWFDNYADEMRDFLWYGPIEVPPPPTSQATEGE